MQAVLVLSGVLFQEMPVRKACAKVGFPFEQLLYPQRSAPGVDAFGLGLGHVALDRPVGSLSGGETTRVVLASLFLR